MKKFIKFILLFGFVSILSVNVFAQENIGTILLRKKMQGYTPTFETEGRHNEDDRRFEQRHIDFGVIFPFKNDWSVSVNYRALDKYNNSSKEWNEERRSYFAIQKIFKTDPVNISFKTTQEYRYFENNTESIRSRFRLKISSNKAFFNLKPFLSNEVFYDFNAGNFIRNRAEIGVDFPKTNYGKYSLYYRYQKSENSEDKKYWDSYDSVIIRAIFDF